MNRLFFTALLLGSLSASAQTTISPEIRSALPQKSETTPSAISFEAGADVSVSAFANNENYNVGRSTLTGMTPRLVAHLPSDVALHGSVPFLWVSNRDSQWRYIGRPEFGAWQTMNLGLTQLSYGLDLRFPLFDSSTGLSEAQRIWGFYPGYNAKVGFSRTQFHILQSGGLAINSAAQQLVTNPSGSSYTSDSTNPPVLLVGAGGGVDLSSKASVDMTVNLANSLGVGHYKQINTSQGSTISFQGDIPGADLSYVKLAGTFEVAKGSRVTSYVVKSLKDSSNHGTGGLQTDDAPNFASLGAGVGFTQTF